jgi:alanine-glyoxylate transaminase/serine-glyoxylate transaminase/serine-pyruvate transaminase
MTAKRGINFLQTPGPTHVPDRVLQAMQRQSIDFAGERFREIALSCYPDVRKLFRTEGEVFLYTCNGHGAWEAVLSNLFSPGDRVLVPETGMFSLSWKGMAEALGVVVEYLESDWRHAVDPARVEQRLREDSAREIKAVLLVHTDTATSVTSDVAAVRRAIDAAGHPALFAVDAVASLATTDFRMDDWGVDATLSASQKGLMLPPGLAIVAANEKALAACEEATLPRFYWDWRERLKEHHYKWFCGTAPEHLVFGLRAALDLLAEEGPEATFARHRRLARAARAAVGTWAQGGALDFNVVEPVDRAEAVTTVLMAEGGDANAVRDTCYDRFDVSLGTGLGQLDGRGFRIAHMGDVNEPMLLGALGSVEATLKILGIPHGAGVTAAIESLAGQE